MFHVIDLMRRESRTHGEVTIRTGVFRDWTEQLAAEWVRLTEENEALKQTDREPVEVTVKAGRK